MNRRFWRVASALSALHRPARAGCWSTSPFSGLLLADSGSGRRWSAAYTEYRKRRLLMLHGYCLNLLQENRALKRAVGIGIDASRRLPAALEVPKIFTRWKWGNGRLNWRSPASVPCWLEFDMAQSPAA